MRPPGWPEEVCDPEDAEFVTSAQRWLWDVGAMPRDLESAWTRHPQAHAFRVCIDLQARLDGARTAYASVRSALHDSDVDVPAVLAEIESEASLLQRWQREAQLVAEALAGRRWGRRL